MNDLKDKIGEISLSGKLLFLVDPLSCVEMKMSHLPLYGVFIN